MHVGHIKDAIPVELKSPELKDVRKQVLVGPQQGWEGWVMRLFTLSPGGYTPRHSHPWPHINYVTGGEGNLFLGGQEHLLEAGSTAFVPPGVEHQFQNRGEGDLLFICIVPQEGEA